MCMAGPSSLRRFLFRGFFGGALLFRASAGQCVVQAVISFVTRVLEDRSFVLLPRDFRRPRSGPRRGIVDGELIAERLFVDAGEPLGQMHVLARALERELVGEV